MTENWRRYARPFARTRRKYALSAEEAISKVRCDNDALQEALCSIRDVDVVDSLWRDFVEHMRREGKP